MGTTCPKMCRNQPPEEAGCEELMLERRSSGFQCSTSSLKPSSHPGLFWWFEVAVGPLLTLLVAVQEGSLCRRPGLEAEL